MRFLEPVEWELLSCWWRLELLVCCFKTARSFIYFGCLSLAFGCYFHTICLSSFCWFLFFLFLFQIAVDVQLMCCGRLHRGEGRRGGRGGLLPANGLKSTCRSSELYRFTRQHVHSYRFKTMSSLIRNLDDRRRGRERERETTSYINTYILLFFYGLLPHYFTVNTEYIK